MDMISSAEEGARRSAHTSLTTQMNGRRSPLLRGDDRSSPTYLLVSKHGMPWHARTLGSTHSHTWQLEYDCVAHVKVRHI